MNKGKSTWKYNKLLTARRNYFDLGGALKNITLKDLAKAFPIAGELAGGFISGGLESGAGKTIQGLSNIASVIPGLKPVAGGLKVVGGLANAMFGSNLNEGNIAKVEENINNLNHFQSNASDFDTLSQNWAKADIGMTFDNSYIGKDGWFSNTAKNKANDLRNQINTGNIWVRNSLMNNADNISISQAQNLLGNYHALGGPLTFAEGGSIHINPKNKGKFTETKKRTGKTTEELTHSKNPLTRKRAIFAKNAKKWHHALGGGLNTQGGNFTNGLVQIDNGGSHSSNPLEGVPMGADTNGIPNLVEEGETIFNDYVFSKRLHVPKAIRNKYKMRGAKEVSFADMSKWMAKESEERPNDPISQKGLEAMMLDLAISQENVRQKKRKSVPSQEVIEEPPTGEIPSTEIPQEEAPQEEELQEPIEELQEEEPQEEISQEADKFSYGGPMGNIYAGEGPKDQFLRFTPSLFHKNGAMEYNPFEVEYSTNKGPTRVLGSWTRSNTPGIDMSDDFVNPFRTYSYMSAPISKPVTKPKDPKFSETDLRYAPVIGSGLAAITDAFGLTNKPDYSGADAIMAAARDAENYASVKFNPIGNYLTYKPFDRDFYINKLNADTGASRRALLNNSGGNRATAMAGILAADNNYFNQVGNLARQAEEYNFARKKEVEDFNRGTNLQNSEGFLKAAMANQQARSAAKELYMRGVLTATNLKQQERQLADTNKSKNLSRFFQSLGDMGYEAVNKNLIEWAIKNNLFGPVKDFNI